MSTKNKKFDAIRVNGELPDPRTVVVGDIVEDLWATYVEEMGSFLSRLEKAAMLLESDKNNNEALPEIRRILHSIKGDSGMCGILDVHDLCHEVESALDEFHEKGHLTDVLLKVKDWMTAVIENLSNVDISDEKNKEVAEIKSKPKLKALVVDDDIICRERLKMLLQDFFDCTFACNGKEGLLIYEESLKQKNPYPLITLDINMPELNGHETLEAIRRAEEQHDIRGLDGAKVIMTTSEGGSEHVFAAFKEGCEAYVVKTKMGDKLLDEIAKLGLLKVVKVEKAYVVD
jgi:two-component system chemotaxis response regulator CheY